MPIKKKNEAYKLEYMMEKSDEKNNNVAYCNPW